MFEELTTQGYQQMVRHVIFQIYEILVDKYLNGNFKSNAIIIIFILIKKFLIIIFFS